MHRAKFFIKLKEDIVQCRLCPRYCVIKSGEWGSCGARKNIRGTLSSEVYGKIAACHTDPIEKKPLYHFVPGSRTFSIATVGCNLHCRFCQNWELSQAKQIFGEKFSPELIVSMAKKEGAEGISYTYTEPTIFYEFAYDTARLAKKAGLYNVLVTNGYINPEPLLEIARFIDAANVDIKAFSDAAYKEYCGIPSMKPILASVRQMSESGIHLELTNLIVPGMNDEPKMIKNMCGWICRLDPEIPLHFSRYHPEYLLRAPPTPIETLVSAYNIAKTAGLKYVYIGNIFDEKYNTTYCPECNRALIARRDFCVTEIGLKNRKCPFCSAGVLLRGTEFKPMPL